MITLKYRRITPTLTVIDPFYLLCEVVSGEADKVRFEIPGRRVSELIILDKKFRLKDGICEVNFTDLPNGVVEPFVFEERKSLFTTWFLKENNSIIRLPADNLAYEQMKKAYEELCDEISESKEKISTLEEKILPPKIFNFD